MTVNEYMTRVIELFQSGLATREQWKEMAQIVMLASEDGKAPEIDKTIERSGESEGE